MRMNSTKPIGRLLHVEYRAFLVWSHPVILEHAGIYPGILALDIETWFSSLSV